jgi:hypothetical protein
MVERDGWHLTMVSNTLAHIGRTQDWCVVCDHERVAS